MSSQVQSEPKKKLGERLIDAGLIDEIQLAVALGMQKQTGLKLGQQLLKLGFLSEEELSPFLSEQVDMSISLSQRNISAQTIKSIPQDLAFKYKVCPVAFDGKTIVLAMSDPKDITVIDDLVFRLGKKIHPVRALEWDIDTALLKYYSDFTDDELSKLTSASSAAQTYQSAQWTDEDEEHLRRSKGGDDDHTAYGDLSDLLTQGDTPDMYVAGHDDWTASPDVAPSAPPPQPAPKPKPKPAPALPPRPVVGQQGTPEGTRAAKPEPAPRPTGEKTSQPAKAQTKTAAGQRPSPLAKPAAASGTAAPSAQQKRPSPAAGSPAPKAPEKKPAVPPAPEEQEKATQAQDALSALASTARKRFTIQQALVDLLIEKKVITERDLLNKLIKLEGALGDEDE